MEIQFLLPLTEKLPFAMHCAGLRRRHLSSGMGNGESSLHQGGNSGEVGGVFGHR